MTKHLRQRRGPAPANGIGRASHQTGVAMIVALVMLVIISLSSAAMMRGAMNTDVVINNTRIQNQAMQAAQVALRYCERQVPINGISIRAKGVSGAAWSSFSNWFGNTRVAEVTAVPDSAMQSANSAFTLQQLPECLAEHIGLGDGSDAILITVRGFSADYTEDSTTGRLKSGSVVWLQSTLKLT